MAEMNDVGRNDPCPCGSGKRHTRCCLAHAEAIDLTWQRLRRAEGRLIDKTLTFARKHYQSDVILRAWDAFSLGDESNLADDPMFESSFVPWFVFNWVPDPALVADDTLPAGIPLSLQMLALQPDQFDEFETRFTHAMCGRPFSFYSVTAVEPGRGLTLKDILTQRERTVLERSASATVTRGGILFTRLLEMDGVAIMCGCAPLVIPGDEHLRLLDLRHELTRRRTPMTEEQVHTHAEALRDTYFEIADRLDHPQLPTLCNTDGDPLLPQTLHFDLRCSPQAAFDRLRSLSLERTDEQCMENPRYDAGGALRAVRFAWLKHGNAKHADWDNTILGTVRIDGARLTVEVNSQPRGNHIRREVERRLADDVSYRTTVVESLEKGIEDRLSRPETAKERRAREAHERLNALPEVREQLRVMAAAHWERWLDGKIPALRNRTPRQASRTAEGRERLDALLQSFETDRRVADDSPFRPDVPALRKRLGLGP